MPELITIEEAARITGFPSEDIQYCNGNLRRCNIQQVERSFMSGAW